MTGRCTLVCCAFDRERANRGPGRRSLTPLYSPAAATRDAAAGDSKPQHGCVNGTLLGGADGPGMASGASVVRDQPSRVQLPGAERSQTSSVCHGDTAPEPVGRLGGVVTLDPLSGTASPGEGAADPSVMGLLGSEAVPDSYPGPAGRVSGLTRQYLAAAGEPRLWGLS